MSQMKINEEMQIIELYQQIQLLPVTAVSQEYEACTHKSSVQ